MMAVSIVISCVASAASIPLVGAQSSHRRRHHNLAPPTDLRPPFIPSRSKPVNSFRFDWWTKSLARAGSRRAVLRTFAAGGVAALARFGLVEVAAACRKNGKKCKKSKQCCSKKCRGKKCRCTPLKGSCPGSDADHVCCSNPGAAVSCSFMINKPQCGPNGFRCLRGLDSPCSEDCQCGGELECEGSPDARCCIGLGNACAEGPSQSQCCSQQCGCTAPGSCTCRFANCKSPGQSCSLLHTQCCDGICSSGECCLPKGIACTSTPQCCGALSCDNGVCDTP
jgi:hypothetical protein